MPLVTVDWLRVHQSAADLVIVEATFFMPAENRDAASEHRAGHIPKSVFFDIDMVADHNVDLPHMLPQPDHFAHAVGALGIGNHTHVICVDRNSFMASARLWWMFRAFGHDRVSVLDGGIAAWKNAGHALTGETVKFPVQPFKADYRPSLVTDLAAMRRLQRTGTAQIVDARSAGRFTGTEPEPRGGVRSGHIPGSRNLHFRSLIDDQTHRLKDNAAIMALVKAAKIDRDKPIVTTCGTGVSAAIIALALYRMGQSDVPVYDGSWTEWGSQPDTPAETGPAV